MPAEPLVDAYIARQPAFARPILAELRARVHACCPDIAESIKWSRPAFSRNGRLIAGMGAFKAHVAFHFRDGAPIHTGRESEALGQLGRIETLADLPDEATFAAWLRAAIERSDAGRGAARTRVAKPAAPVPPELATALAGDPVASATFEGFPPSARRDYCEWIAEAKRDATRQRRIDDALAWLREGKRRNWRYERC